MEFLIVLAVVALVTWKFLSYVDGMMKQVKHLEKQQFRRSLANFHKEARPKCVLCVKGDNHGRYSRIL